jgi:hypothetical protein
VSATVVWILVAVAGLMVVSCVVGAAVAAVLGHIGREVSELLEGEAWASAPLTPRARGRPRSRSLSHDPR